MKILKNTMTPEEKQQKIWEEQKLAFEKLTRERNKKIEQLERLRINRIAAEGNNQLASAVNGLIRKSEIYCGIDSFQVSAYEDLLFPRNINGLSDADKFLKKLQEISCFEKTERCSDNETFAVFKPDIGNLRKYKNKLVKRIEKEKVDDITIEKKSKKDREEILKIKTRSGLLSVNKSGLVKLNSIKGDFNPTTQEFKTLLKIIRSRNYTTTYEDLLGEKNVSKTSKRGLTFVIRNIKRTLGILSGGKVNKAKNTDKKRQERLSKANFI